MITGRDSTLRLDELPVELTTMEEREAPLSERQREILMALEPILKSPDAKATPIGRALVLHEHRTHQQCVVRNTVALMRGIAQALVYMEETGGHDARNEAATEFCKKFIEFVDEADRGMPFI